MKYVKKQYPVEAFKCTGNKKDLISFVDGACAIDIRRNKAILRTVGGAVTVKAGEYLVKEIGKGIESYGEEQFKELFTEYEEPPKKSKLLLFNSVDEVIEHAGELPRKSEIEEFARTHFKVELDESKTKNEMLKTLKEELANSGEFN